MGIELRSKFVTCHNGGRSDKRHEAARPPQAYSIISIEIIMIHGDLYILIIDTYIKTLIFLSSVSLNDFIADSSEEIDNFIKERICL